MTSMKALRLFPVDDSVEPTTVRAPRTAALSESDMRPARSAQLRLSISVASLVEEFHLAFGLPVSARATADLPVYLTDLRKRLLAEETEELSEAIDRHNLEEIAGELADVLYVLYGTAITFGIDLDEVVAEVHRSNMSKLDKEGNPTIREDGKVLKGPNYAPPNLLPLLQPQS